MFHAQRSSEIDEPTTTLPSSPMPGPGHPGALDRLAVASSVSSGNCGCHFCTLPCMHQQIRPFSPGEFGEAFQEPFPPPRGVRRSKKNNFHPRLWRTSLVVACPRIIVSLANRMAVQNGPRTMRGTLLIVHALAENYTSRSSPS